jgi:hypothetical protein
MASTVREWRHDRSDWEADAGPGPWNDEPDKIQWIDEATDLDCLMHRNHSGAWCGYVGVAEGHPMFEKPYGAVDVEVNGGLTYADFCQPVDDESHGICHTPFEGRPHRVWWLGFDCAHAFDLMPGTIALDRRFGSIFYDDRTYRDRAYVEAQCRSLAQQLKQLASARSEDLLNASP